MTSRDVSRGARWLVRGGLVLLYFIVLGAFVWISYLIDHGFAVYAVGVVNLCIASFIAIFGMASKLFDLLGSLVGRKMKNVHRWRPNRHSWFASAGTRVGSDRNSCRGCSGSA